MATIKSLEEKAKAYDEAIKRVENIKAGKCETTFMFTEGLFEYIFPELKESEGEKIRKELIEYFKENNAALAFKGISNECVIAWLEKQGEQKHQYKSRPRYVGETELLGQQKPVSEMKTPEESLGIDSETYSKIVDECIYGEQKSAEWSEEDEKIALSIEQIFNCASLLNIVPDKIEKVKSWLKSLKERCTWRPSKEQMEALRECIPENVKELSKWEMVLDGLYNDLIKLREE